MQSTFYKTNVFRTASNADTDNCPRLLCAKDGALSTAKVRRGLERNDLVLLRETAFDSAVSTFRELVEYYGLEKSYDVQMQYVVTRIGVRDPVGNVAVTVNKREPHQIIQPHSEGDSTSPLDLFGLYCVRAAELGGENILSLVDQRADHSRLRAKEKAIVAANLSPSELRAVQGDHWDAKDVLAELPGDCRILRDTPSGKVVVRPVPLTPSISIITGESLISYWDNVTVHDRAFHRYHHALLRELGILHSQQSNDYESYMHVEDDSDWAPADTDSGDVEQTSNLFESHVVHKMQAGDFLVFNNRAWTHAVNNWPSGQVRELNAMYA